MTLKVFEYGRDKVKPVLSGGFKAEKGRLEGQEGTSYENELLE